MDTQREKPPCRTGATTIRTGITGIIGTAGNAWVSLSLPRRVLGQGARLDCGENGVVGHADEAAPNSGRLWLEHALERFRWLGINHDVWDANMGGFTWSVPEYKQTVEAFWKRHHPH